jgi:pyruvate formate lyase activating enzyme
VFLQGCKLRCLYCHNPETWNLNINEAIEITPHELVKKVEKYKNYYGEDGGVTFSGGEPLLQPEFLVECLKLCKEKNIHTCLDTAGCIWNDGVRELLSHTDRVLLDIKYKNDALYRANVGCGIDTPLSFLAELDKKGIKTTLRQVTVPTLNDDEENDEFLRSLITAHPCIDKIELLPFRKLCSVKYESLGIPFPFAHYPEPDSAAVAARERALSAYLDK